MKHTAAVSEPRTNTKAELRAIKAELRAIKAELRAKISTYVREVLATTRGCPPDPLDVEAEIEIATEAATEVYEQLIAGSSPPPDRATLAAAIAAARARRDEQIAASVPPNPA
jgi:hypothetical protein